VHKLERLNILFFLVHFHCGWIIIFHKNIQKAIGKLLHCLSLSINGYHSWMWPSLFCSIISNNRNWSSIAMIHKFTQIIFILFFNVFTDVVVVKVVIIKAFWFWKIFGRRPQWREHLGCAMVTIRYYYNMGADFNMIDKQWKLE